MHLERFLEILSKEAQALTSVPILSSLALVSAVAVPALIFRRKIRGLKAQLYEIEAFKAQIEALMVQLEERLRFANDRVSDITKNLKRAEWTIIELKMNIAQQASPEVLQANTTTLQSSLSVASAASEAVHEVLLREST